METGRVLIEIGCEDLPSWSGEHFSRRFIPLLSEELKSRSLNPEEIMLFFTPRRIVIFIKNIPVEIPPQQKEITGPRYENAFDEKGNPSPAAKGFAKAHNVSVSSLKIKEANGKKVVYIIKKIPGIPSIKVISEIIPSLLRKLDIPRGMKWNDSGEVFYRPVRWILALFDSRCIPFTFGGIKSSKYTFGHRVLHPEKLKIKNWKDYFDRIQKGYVIVDQQVRSRFILDTIKTLLKSDETIDGTDIEEIANLVEYPRVIRCNFPDINYTVPEMVLQVLIKKAKGIPIVKDGKLQKEFFVISDGNTSEMIRKNYENLLKTRILDAQFFFDSDISVSLNEFKRKLDGIVFHQKWGSVAKRVERLRNVSDEISSILSLDEKNRETLLKAIELFKLDLASEMVREFPELHGIMGAIYAKNAGESDELCQVIAQYSYPRYSGDRLPESICGMVLGIIDRIDYICAFISAGADVSGSEDPYGLRRITAGIFPLAYKLGIECDYQKIVKVILNSYQMQVEQSPVVEQKIVDFITQRFEAHLELDGFSRGLRMSVLVVDRMNFLRVRKKLEAMVDFIKKVSDADVIIIPVSRVANILKQAEEKKFRIEEFKNDLLEEDGEKALAEIYENFSKKVEHILEKGNYGEFLNTLSELKKPIDDFFDNVLVMCPDERLRTNRLALLKKFNDTFLKFADFSYIREEDIKNARKN